MAFLSTKKPGTWSLDFPPLREVPRALESRASRIDMKQKGLGLFGRGRVLVEQLAVGIALGDATLLGGELEGFLAIELGLVHQFVDTRREGLCRIDVGTSGSLVWRADDEGNLALCGMFLQRLKNLREFAAAEFLMQLGDFTGEAGGTIS